MKFIITIEDVEGSDMAHVNIKAEPPIEQDTKMTAAGSLLISFLEAIDEDPNKKKLDLNKPWEDGEVN